MAGMGSTAKAVDAGVAGFNWNSPLAAHLARARRKDLKRRGWEKTDEPWRARSFFERPPPFLQPSKVAFPWPTNHPVIVATFTPPTQLLIVLRPG